MPVRRVSKRDQIANAVRALNIARRAGYSSVGPESLSDGYEAIFELIEQEWDISTVDFNATAEKVWRAGYEQAIVDIVDAIADEWGVVVWEE